MKLSPAEIRKQDFRRTLLGYGIDDVRSFLDLVAQSVDELRTEQEQLKHSLADLERQVTEYRSVEQAMHSTFLQAQETGGVRR